MIQQLRRIWLTTIIQQLRRIWLTAMIQQLRRIWLTTVKWYATVYFLPKRNNITPDTYHLNQYSDDHMPELRIFCLNVLMISCRALCWTKKPSNAGCWWRMALLIISQKIRNVDTPQKLEQKKTHPANKNKKRINVYTPHTGYLERTALNGTLCSCKYCT